jgi:hypothetical protein
MIDNVYQLILLIIVGSLFGCLVLLTASFTVTQIIKAQYASIAALREQEHEHRQAQQVDLP